MPPLSSFLWRCFPPDQACEGHPSSGRRWNNIVARQSYTNLICISKHEPWTVAYSVCSLNSSWLIKPSWKWSTDIYYYYFLSTERFSWFSNCVNNGKLKKRDERKLQYNTILLSKCGKHLSLCTGTARHSDHRCSLCTVDMNDACLCLGLMWLLLSTSSWGHCSVSEFVVFPYRFRRRSAVRWSCVSLTLR